MRPGHWLFTIPLRLRSLFRWAQADQELDDELRDHLERGVEVRGCMRTSTAKKAIWPTQPIGTAGRASPCAWP